MKYISNITRNYFISSLSRVVKMVQGQELSEEEAKHLSDAILNNHCTLIEDEPTLEEKKTPKKKK